MNNKFKNMKLNPDWLVGFVDALPSLGGHGLFSYLND